MSIGVFKYQTSTHSNSDLKFLQHDGGEPLHRLKGSTSKFFYPSKMFTNSQPPMLKKQTWDDNKLYEGSLMKRYHNEIKQSYALNYNNKPLVPVYLQGQGYSHLANATSKLNSELNLNSFMKCQPQEVKISGNMSADPSMRRSNTSHGTESMEPLVEKIEVHKKKASTGKKNKTHRSKSGKSRGRKSVSKKRKQSNNNIEKPALSLQTNSKSKFHNTIYSADQNTQQSKTSMCKSAEKLKLSELANFRVNQCDSSDLDNNNKNNLLLQELPNHLVLPPTKIKNEKSPPSTSNDFESQKTPTIPCRVLTPLIKSPYSEDLTKKYTPSKTEEIILPPAPIGKASPLSALKPDANFGPSTTKKLFSTICKQGCIKKCHHFDRNLKQSDNGLGQRLSLIHSYGCDYQDITKKAEMQRRREKASQQHQNRLIEKEISENKKQEQRKKIYALNKLMTKLEHEKFKEFMAGLDSSSEAAIE